MFRAVCETLGVTVRKTSAGVPQSNGQVERWNREVKRALRKYLAGAPGSRWWDWLGNVRTGLRMCVTGSHHFSPFHLQYKQDPRIAHLALPDDYAPDSFVVDEEDQSALTEKLIGAFEATRAAVARALHA